MGRGSDFLGFLSNQGRSASRGEPVHHPNPNPRGVWIGLVTVLPLLFLATASKLIGLLGAVDGIGNCPDPVNLAVRNVRKEKSRGGKEKVRDQWKLISVGA
ncbi:hypothetical protein MRB53_018639 [Persea americana]|uniref:Uncharacterized protein n=1 Tax=Persea americana TaxID=3435 RepID=A0ACC2M8F0_PERAE|nr:hypothetical protein MRB53_018639 [Persea americana]